MTVLRRLDCVLQPEKEKALGYSPKVEKLLDRAKDVTLGSAIPVVIAIHFILSLHR